MIEHIEFLVQEHDCVIIPGLGAIIAQYSSAVICNGTIMPPKRSLSFNESITHSDGLLADSVSRREKIQFSVANSKILKEVEAIKLQLKNGNEFAIGRLGFIKLNDESKLEFTPFVSTLLQNNLFGLQRIEMPTLAALKQCEPVNNVVELKRHKTSRTLVAKRFMQYAASIIMLVVLSLVLTTPIALDKSNGDFATLSIIKSQVELARQIEELDGDLSIALPSSSSVEIVDTIKENQIDLVKVEKQIKPQPEQEIEVVENNIEPTESKKYYLIVSSLVTLEQAKNHIKEAGNSSMQILHSDGKYRIYIASSDSMNILTQIKKEQNIDSLYPGAWICRK
ncbi:MAG: hypothetical protein PHR45_04520 [Muribaculaceae bacterium]|nr:hypothetical protein [Muribaculaceae bacterium]